MVKVYADTSVFGGCFDDEFEEWSNKLMREFNLGLKSAVISADTKRTGRCAAVCQELNQ